MLLVASCWGPCGGLASHPWRSCNTPSCFMLGTLWCTSIIGTDELPGSFNSLDMDFTLTNSQVRVPRPHPPLCKATHLTEKVIKRIKMQFAESIAIAKPNIQMPSL